MDVDKKLYEEIKEYCKLNGLKVREFVNSLLKKAFMVEKYGIAPAVVRNTQTNTEEPLKIIEIQTDSQHEIEENVGKDVAEPLNADQSVKDETKVSKNENIQVEKKQTIKKRKL